MKCVGLYCLVPVLLIVFLGCQTSRQHPMPRGPDACVKNNHEGREPLHIAARRGHKKTVRLLVTQGADINAKDNDDYTPLHYALIGAHTEIATFLIRAGADVNTRARNNGMTPLHLAAMQGFTKLVGLLISKGADVNAGDDGGNPPLHAAT